ncbi:P-loop containing nucleoside triphosphate hydrolase protein [Suillus americanus]|nr:P-loop containing nucleoside triphosphate hydrolase protein [Suillus americanus]
MPPHPGANHAEKTCNVVIFGETGAGKSSLINLITKKHTAQTSRDTTRCTTRINEYYVLSTESIQSKVKLFDTPGLDDSEGSEDARRVLEKLLQNLRGDIHLLIYCVRGTSAGKALYHNCNFVRSKVDESVPIVLVVTFLEDQKPEMEGWWRNNEQTISGSQMTFKFTGHACVTTATVDKPDKLKGRHKQSYRAVCQLIEQHRLKGVQPSTNFRPKTIVLFGETGAGKSSLVNLMAGREVAYTSPDMQRATLRWNEYAINFDGNSYTVFDTIGLEEPQLGINEYLESVENAYKLIRELDKQGGIDLLLFCVRAGRVTSTLQSNYRLFNEFLCEKKVPIVLAITNLEREKKMEDWWDRNKDTFGRYQIQVAGHACITAANRLDGRHKVLYEESRITIRKLVEEFTADGKKEAWKGGDNVFVSLMRKLKELLVGSPSVSKKDLVPHLTKRCGISKDVAKQLADMIKSDTD